MKKAYLHMKLEPANEMVVQQAIFKLDPPMINENWDGSIVEEHEYVLVSAANVMFSGPETYIFPANKEGEVIEWGELPGSFRGGLDMEEALNNAGYEVITMIEK
jgi:hypothetical protein